jgi:AcrR family transcriptional regulator
MKSDKRKEQILETAIKAFSEHGFEKTSIALICGPLKIARGTLYQYFKNKQDLFLELVKIYIGRIQDLLHPFNFEEGTAHEFNVYRYNRLKDFFEEIYNNKEIYGVILREGLKKKPQTEKIVMKLHFGFIKKLEEEYKKASELGYLSVADPEFAAVSTYGSIIMVIQKYIIYADDPSSPEDLTRKVTEAYNKSLIA